MPVDLQLNQLIAFWKPQRWRLEICHFCVASKRTYHWTFNLNWTRISIQQFAFASRHKGRPFYGRVFDLKVAKTAKQSSIRAWMESSHISFRRQRLAVGASSLSKNLLAFMTGFHSICGPRVNKQQQGAERNLVNKLQHSIKITFVRSLALFIKQLIKQVNQEKLHPTQTTFFAPPSTPWSHSLLQEFYWKLESKQNWVFKGKKRLTWKHKSLEAEFTS